MTSVFWPGRAVLGEGPLWDPRIDTLYWVDIIAGSVFAQAANAHQPTPTSRPPWSRWCAPPSASAINRLALQTTSNEGLTIRAIDSPTAHRNVALFWMRRRGDSAVVKAFLDAQERASLPPGVLAV